MGRAALLAHYTLNACLAYLIRSLGASWVMSLRLKKEGIQKSMGMNDIVCFASVFLIFFKDQKL